MKNSKTIFAFAVLAALASCSNEHVISQPDEVATPIRIQANVGAVATKAATDVQNTKFDNGEKVNVYIFENADFPTYIYGKSGDGLVEYTADNRGYLTTTTTQYYPANGKGIDVFGVYPNTVKKGNNQTFSVSDNQSNDENYKNSDLMFASGVRNHTKGDVSLDFEHKLSKIIVKLEKGNGFKENLNNATVKIIGTITECNISPSKEGVGLTEPTFNGENQKAITVGTWSEDDTNNGIAAIVVPQTLSKGTDLFEVKLAGGTTYKYKIPVESEDVKFDSGKVYTYTLTLTTAEIKVSSSAITPWTEGADTKGDATLEYPDSNP